MTDQRIDEIAEKWASRWNYGLATTEDTLQGHIKSAILEATTELRKDSERLEHSFREGYKVGYENGGSDVASYECGFNKHPEIKVRDENDSWRDSDTKAAIDAAMKVNHD